MQLIKRVIQLAKDRALIKFSALTRLMVRDADDAMVAALSDTRSGLDRKALTAALQYMRQEQVTFQRHIDALFRESVDRALRTMYTDLRQGLTNMSAATLTLIDDEAVNRQIEVGHLVQRLRDACNENLGRLNMMIAQIHGDADVHERENPFRPYLIARALHDTLKEKVADEETAKVLFGQLSNSLAVHLSDYYASICEVFDASGIQTKLMARPTKLKRHQRDQLAKQLASLNAQNSGMHTGTSHAGAVSAVAPELNPRVMSSLQRMFDLVQNEKSPDSGLAKASDAAGSSLQQINQTEEFQDFVWKLFNQTQTAVSPDRAMQQNNGDRADGNSANGVDSFSVIKPASSSLIEQLDQFQQVEAEVPASDEPAVAEKHQLIALNDKLDTDKTSQGERIAIDLVTLLFEFILEDEQIPAEVRAQIGRMQIPFLKAAMLAPDLLHTADHPARQLLNEMSSAAIGLDSASPMGQQVIDEIARLVKRILKEFDKDMAIFTNCQQELHQFLENQLRHSDAEMARSVEAAEDAEKFSALLHNTGTSLLDILTPLNLDQRIVDFIILIWARVLVRASIQGEASIGSAAAVSQQYRDVLPELVWSAQEKQTPEDRNALMKLLPGLVKRLKIGMLMINLAEDERQIALDRLVAVHTQVLQPNPVINTSKKLPSLEALRKEFTRLVINDDDAAWSVAEKPFQVQPEALEKALAERGANADLDLTRDASANTTPSNNELLKQMQVGTSVQFWAADTFVVARVSWISKHHSLFIFKMEQNAKPLVYSAASLAKALQEGKVRLVEYAPAFDRAVDSLMMGAEAMQAGRR